MQITRVGVACLVAVFCAGCASDSPLAPTGPTHAPYTPPAIDCATVGDLPCQTPAPAVPEVTLCAFGYSCYTAPAPAPVDTPPCVPGTLRPADGGRTCVLIP